LQLPFFGGNKVQAATNNPFEEGRQAGFNNLIDPARVVRDPKYVDGAILGHQQWEWFVKSTQDHGHDFVMPVFPHFHPPVFDECRLDDGATILLRDVSSAESGALHGTSAFSKFGD
jgi:hypothetical protein